MSKSSGDFLRLQSLIDEGFSSLAYRYFCLTAHYRSELSFSWESLKANDTALNRLYEAAFSWGDPTTISEAYMTRFVEHLYEDLNVPRALAVAWELARSDEPDGVKKATLLAFDEIFGLDIAEWEPAQIDIPDEVLNLVSAREEARSQKDWGKADAVREEIRNLGFEVEDSREGPKIKPL